MKNIATGSTGTSPRLQLLTIGANPTDLTEQHYGRLIQYRQRTRTQVFLRALFQLRVGTPRQTRAYGGI